MPSAPPSPVAPPPVPSAPSFYVPMAAPGPYQPGPYQPGPYQPGPLQPGYGYPAFPPQPVASAVTIQPDWAGVRANMIGALWPIAGWAIASLVFALSLLWLHSLSAAALSNPSSAAANFWAGPGLNLDSGSNPWFVMALAFALTMTGGLGFRTFPPDATGGSAPWNTADLTMLAALVVMAVLMVIGTRRAFARKPAQTASGVYGRITATVLGIAVFFYGVTWILLAVFTTIPCQGGINVSGYTSACAQYPKVAHSPNLGGIFIVFLGVLWIAGLIGAARDPGTRRLVAKPTANWAPTTRDMSAKIVGAVGWTSAGWVVCVIVLGLIAPLYIGLYALTHNAFDANTFVATLPSTWLFGPNLIAFAMVLATGSHFGFGGTGATLSGGPTLYSGGVDAWFPVACILCLTLPALVGGMVLRWKGGRMTGTQLAASAVTSMMLLVLLAGFAGMSVTFSTGSQSVTQTLLFDLGQVILVGGLVMVVATLGGYFLVDAVGASQQGARAQAAYQAQMAAYQAQMAAYQAQQAAAYQSAQGVQPMAGQPAPMADASATAFAGSTVVAPVPPAPDAASGDGSTPASEEPPATPSE